MNVTVFGATGAIGSLTVIRLISLMAPHLHAPCPAALTRFERFATDRVG